MKYETIIVEPGPITWVTLNRPERRNAMNRQMDEEVLHALHQAEKDQEVRVSILKGNGPCFSAGHDLYEVAEHFAKYAGRDAESVTQRAIDLEIWQDMRKPIIGAVHGFLGPMAVRILHVLDLAVAAEGTVFSYEQVRAGGAPPPLIPTLTMGHKKLKEWQLLAGVLTAEDAERHAIINKVVPMDKLYKTAEEWGRNIVSIPPQSVLANKHLINQVYEMVGVRTTYTLAACMNAVAHGSGDDKAFFNMVLEKGLKPALEFRDRQFGGRKVGHAGRQW